MFVGKAGAYLSGAISRVGFLPYQQKILYHWPQIFMTIQIFVSPPIETSSCKNATKRFYLFAKIS
jgi:hypothetical protein